MHGYFDFILAAIFAISAVYAFTSKNMVGKSKERYYTKESREKFSRVSGCLYALGTLVSIIYALGNHGIIGFKLNMWVFYIVIIAIVALGVLVAEKLILKKTEEAEAMDSIKKGGDEDF